MRSVANSIRKIFQRKWQLYNFVVGSQMKEKTAFAQTFKTMPYIFVEASEMLSACLILSASKVWSTLVAVCTQFLCTLDTACFWVCKGWAVDFASSKQWISTFGSNDEVCKKVFVIHRSYFQWKNKQNYQYLMTWIYNPNDKLRDVRVWPLICAVHYLMCYAFRISCMLVGLRRSSFA